MHSIVLVHRVLAVSVVIPAALVLGGGAIGCGGNGGTTKKVEVGAPGQACERACRVWGWCADVGGQCMAASDEHCRNSERCKEGGLCSLKDGKCLAASDSDCKRSKWCEKYDWCSADQGVCVR